MTTCVRCGNEFTPAGPPPPLGAKVICPRCAAGVTWDRSAPQIGADHRGPVKSNTLGISGLICSVVGIFTLIFLIPGLILSLLGLRKTPRGTAIAGTVVGVAGVVLWGLLLAILIPSLARAKMLAGQMLARTNETTIWQQCIIYAQAHDAQYPPNLATLLAHNNIQPINLVNLIGGSPPLMIPNGHATDTAWIRRHLAGHCDFVYVGKGMTDSAGAYDIVLYTRPGRLGSPGSEMSVLFGDGHTAIVAAAAVPGLFARADKVRQLEKLPPLRTPKVFTTDNAN